MFQLNNLQTLVKKRKRIGRGGSRGGTSGRGNKGQKARSGAHIAALFEGGQMPLSRRLPKRGFTNTPFRTEYQIVNLGSLDRVFEADATVTKEALLEQGLVSSKKSKGGILVKIAGNGQLTKKLNVQADAFTKSAQKAINDRGGQATVTKE
jgi:large subunit ribosomal protein L15